MHPLVREGDRVSLMPIEGEPAPGCILLARTAAGELVCHRVLGRTERGFRLAGDRSFTLEEHLPQTLLGQVCSVERDGRVLRFDGRGPVGWAWRVLDRVLAALHLFIQPRRFRRPGRWLERLRQRLLQLRNLAWRTAVLAG